MAGLALPEFEIVKASALPTPNSITVYGPPGKGKSVFAASISKVPGFERTLHIDTEGSTVAVGPWYPEVDIVHARTADEFTRIVEALLNEKLVEPVSGLPYQVVVVDTFDKAFKRQLEIFDKSKDAKNARGEYNSRYKWGAVLTWADKVADYLHQAPFLTIFVLHSTETDPDKGAVKTTVMLQGQSQDAFPSVSDAVCYFDIVKIKEGPDKGKEIRTADFRQSGRFVSKQRFADKLNGAITDPTMEKVFRLIEPQRFSN